MKRPAFERRSPVNERTTRGRAPRALQAEAAGEVPRFRSRDRPNGAAVRLRRGRVRTYAVLFAGTRSCPGKDRSLTISPLVCIAAYGVS